MKQAVVGRGGVQKNQVNFMVRAIIDGLPAEVPPDAADALAIGMTHFQTENSAVMGRRSWCGFDLRDRPV